MDADQHIVDRIELPTDSDEAALREAMQRNAIPARTGNHGKVTAWFMPR